MATREIFLPDDRVVQPFPMPSDDLGAEISGLDALELPIRPAPGPLRRLWAGAWPKLSAIGLFLLAWQGVVWAHLKPDYVLPGPGPVLRRMFHDIGDGTLVRATATTLQRAGIGYALAVAIGVVIGLAVARNRVLRAAVGSMITGLQTMPTIAWFPLAILLFKLSETAILFVVVLGAAPAIANGVIAGVDNIPPLLLRAGRVLGARGMSSYRHVILPGALPGFVAGLKQGWAFAWRSLMAGELIVIVANKPSLGVRLQFAREMSDAQGLLAAMLALLLIGIAVDSLVFGRLDRAVRRRFGLEAGRV
ncbi:MAG TPA: ABC transporter permease [Acidimicrobiia bacterium]|nr:ABC transporter permease [Acidimicrobiia bacterium]